MRERAITPQLSSQIIDLLIKYRGWTISKVARQIKATRDYVLRVHKAKQQFEFSDVETLARACGEKTPFFIFAALQPEKMTDEQRELHLRTRDLIESHKEFVEAMARKPAKKRRSRAKAA